MDTLLENTNNLLRNLHQKYDQVNQNVQGLQNFFLKMQQSDFEERLSSRLDRVEAKHSSSMKSLKVFIESEDRAREQNMLMRFEDFSMLRQTTTSRLSVYESRLDTLEEMVLDLNQVISPPPPAPSPPPPTTSYTPVMVWGPPVSSDNSDSSEEPVVSDDYEDLAGRDFSMLGLSSPGELDQLEYDCLVPPCDLNTDFKR